MSETIPGTKWPKFIPSDFLALKKAVSDLNPNQNGHGGVHTLFESMKSTPKLSVLRLLTPF